MMHYFHRQECLCYGTKSDFGSTDIPVCVPNRFSRLFAYSWKIAFLVAIAYCCGACTNSTDTSGAYFPKVRLIVQQNCLSCHSPGGAGMPTNLTTDANIVALAAAIKAATIDPASPRNKRMPQGGELSAADKAVIQQWFDKGGKISD